MLQTLLLNSTYEPISFISERKVFKLLYKDKVEVLDYWNDKIRWGSGYSQHPAVVRLKHHVRWIPKRVRFNRSGVFKRDQFICQYCGKALTASKVTIDHVIPRVQGGANSWQNCVCACFECNNFKSSRIPEQARMQLLHKPTVPMSSLYNEHHNMKRKHEAWKNYLIK